MAQERPEVPRERWRQFLDDVTRQYEGSDVTIEVLDSSFGDLTQTERLPLAYVEYDEKDDIFSVGVGGRDGRYPVVLRHGIERPQRILSDVVSPDTPRAFDVVDAEGTQTIITIHRSAEQGGG
ncbi:DUF5335 family protein [Streptosporangium carneum]|uniref:Uncharacterized protein n=1 Tax=Streptosporangium carneum TaxID=47481 RepID=A0A9W6MFI3_9ACTN|nr:DUF5335 family protein [Streptosporangium carneum]GLK11908.1 hypothetical protein GCM10017600_53160 [Streptosporangium carneum]